MKRLIVIRPLLEAHGEHLADVAVGRTQEFCALSLSPDRPNTELESLFLHAGVHDDAVPTDVPTNDLEKYFKAVENADLVKVIGKVIQVVGLIIEAQVQGVSIGDLCTLRMGKGDNESFAEVVGFREGRVLLMPLGTTSGISPGTQVLAAGHPLKVKVGPKLLGRILGGLGVLVFGMVAMGGGSARRYGR